MALRDRVTILTTLGPIATKRFIWRESAAHEDGEIEKIGYDKAAQFKLNQATCANIKDLSALLFKLQEDPKSFVIRADPAKGWKPGQVVKRRAKGNDPSFMPSPDGRCWVMFDIDNAKPPRMGHNQAMDWEAMADWAVQTYLPKFCQDVSFHYQWSSSMGVEMPVKSMKVHLWFWLDRPVADVSVYEWAKFNRSKFPIDVTLFRIVQPHYTAAPIFEGMDDPIGNKRSGLILHGRDTLIAPSEWLSVEAYARKMEDDADVAQARRDALAEAAKAASLYDKRERREKFGTVILERAFSTICGAGEGSRHDTIGRMSYVLGGWIGAGVITEGRAMDILRNAVQTVLPKDRWADEFRNVVESMQAGMARPFNTDEVDAPPAALSATRDLIKYSSPKTPSINPKDSALSGFDDELVKVGVTVHDAPHKSHEIPPGYYMIREGLGTWKVTEAGVKLFPICPAAVMIAGRCIDIEDKAEHLLLAWPRANQWQRRKVTRQQAFSKSIVNVTDFGLPVAEKSAQALGQFLCAYEVTNHGGIPTMHTSTAMGWQERGHYGFSVGYQHIDQQGELRDVRIDERDDLEWSDGIVALSPADSGEAQYAKGFHQKGKYEEWVRVAQMMNAYPRAKAAIIASFAAPLLEIIGAPSFVLEYSSDTSKGKTTAIRAACAVWGLPEDQHPSSLMRTWDASLTGIERLFAFYKSLPVFLDDTRRSRNPEDVPEVFYMVVSGQGRTRGSIKGTTANKGFRTILISTGEEPTSATNNKAGAKARTLEFTRNPLNTQSESEMVAEINRVCVSNYGHAGVRWIQWILKNKHAWPSWRRRYDDCRAEWATKATTGAEGRLFDNLATLDLAWQLVEEALGIGFSDPMRSLTCDNKAVWEELVLEVKDVVGRANSFDELVTWFVANKRHIRHVPGLGATEDHAPSNMHGWYGYYGISVRGGGDEPYIGLNPKPVDEFLKARGFSRAAVLRGWRDEGMLLTQPSDPNRFASRRVTREGDHVNVYTFPARLFMATDEPKT